MKSTTTKINIMSYNYKINKSTTVKAYWKLVPFYSKNVFSVGCPSCELIVKDPSLRTHQKNS